jgi:hypothetical protein
MTITEKIDEAEKELIRTIDHAADYSELYDQPWKDEDLAHLAHLVQLARSAVPSGRVAEDAYAVLEGLGAEPHNGKWCAPTPDGIECPCEALSRLAAGAQRAETLQRERGDATRLIQQESESAQRYMRERGEAKALYQRECAAHELERQERERTWAQRNRARDEVNHLRQRDDKLRDVLVSISNLAVEAAKLVGEPPAVATSQQSLSNGYVRLDDAAALAGAPDWLGSEPFGQARREGFNEGHEKGAEAMRAACWEALKEVFARYGIIEHLYQDTKAAIEGAVP